MARRARQRSVPVDSSASRSDLPTRLATAAVGIPTLLVVIELGGTVYVAVATVLLALGAYELARAAGIGRRDPLAWCTVLGAGAIAGAAALGRDAIPLVVAGLIALTLLVEVLRADVDRGFARWSTAVGAALYPGVLGSHIVLLRQATDGRDWVLLMLFTTFATDTGAYAVGRLLGGPKLAPRISPGKTIAGAVGGLLSGALAAGALGVLLGLGRPLTLWLALGAVVAVAGQVGDLAESLLKRSLGVKDLGRLFPGHGGAMDRLDSVLFTAPVVYWVVQWISG